MAETPKAKAEIISLPNTLKEKVGEGGIGAIDEEVLARAEAIIESLSGEYLTWAREDMENLRAAVQDLRNESGDQKPHLEKIFGMAHDIKGQGGSFGYDLLTIIGNQLCRLVEKLDQAGPSEIEAIEVHVSSMQMVVNEDIKGQGGAAGENLLRGLELVGVKLSK